MVLNKKAAKLFFYDSIALMMCFLYRDLMNYFLLDVNVQLQLFSPKD